MYEPNVRFSGKYYVIQIGPSGESRLESHSSQKSADRAVNILVAHETNRTKSSEFDRYRFEVRIIES